MSDLPHDPNGVTWLPAWKRHGYESYEAWKRPELTDKQREDVLLQLEHMRAEPRGGWPQPQPPPYAADDEDKETPHD